MKRIGCCLAVALCVWCASCRTPREAAAPPRECIDLRPASFLAAVRAEGDGPLSLLSGQSYAVWVGPEVAAFKRDLAVEDGEDEAQGAKVDPLGVTENFVIVECHLESAFADSSIAYDAVGFRHMDVYIETPDGKRVEPVQTVIGPLEEEPRDALKVFRRTNLLVFARRDLWFLRPLVKRDPARVRLVLERHGTQFAFEWNETTDANLWRWAPTEEEARKYAILGYTQLSKRLQRLAHRLD